MADEYDEVQAPEESQMGGGPGAPTPLSALEVCPSNGSASL